MQKGKVGKLIKKLKLSNKEGLTGVEFTLV